MEKNHKRRRLKSELRTFKPERVQENSGLRK